MFLEYSGITAILFGCFGHYVPTHCNTLQHTAAQHTVPQYIQHTPRCNKHRNTLQHGKLGVLGNEGYICQVMRGGIRRYSALQHTVTRCNTL